MISKWGYDADFEELYQANSGLYKNLDNKKILVTGSTGLVGTCLTELLVYMKRLKGLNIDIYTLSSSSDNISQRFKVYVDSEDITPVVQDIRHELPDVGYDYIVHAAGVANPSRYVDSPVDVIDVTVGGTKNILEFSRERTSESNGPRVLYVSSVEVYGDTESIESSIKEDVFGHLDPFQVRSSYTESKRLAETMCKSYGVQYGVDCVVARLSKTYGPSNSSTDERVMAYILNKVVAQEDIVLNSDGSRVFSFCYVTDAVSALLAILIDGKSGEVYNVADKKSVASLKDIAEFSAKMAGVSVSLKPAGVAAISKDTVVDSSRVESLGWVPLTDIESGLRKQYEYISGDKEKL